MRHDMIDNPGGNRPVTVLVVWISTQREFPNESVSFPVPGGSVTPLPVGWSVRVPLLPPFPPMLRALAMGHQDMADGRAAFV